MSDELYREFNKRITEIKDSIPIRPLMRNVRYNNQQVEEWQ